MPAPGPSDILAGALDCEKLGLSPPHRGFSLSEVVDHFLEFGQQFGTASFLGRAADGDCSAASGAGIGFSKRMAAFAASSRTCKSIAGFL